MDEVQNIEETIVDLFGKGDKTVALDTLYKAYGSYMAGVCCRYIPDEHARKDVLQDALLKVCTQIGHFQYRGRGSLRAWITRIVINESLDLLRKEKTTLQMTNELALADLPDEEPDVAGLTEEAIVSLLGKLPPGYRAVVNLYAIEGKSHREIAEILGIKPDSSASQLFRARCMLAKLIKEYKSTH